MKIIGPIPPHILKLMPTETRAPMGKAGVMLDEASEKLRLKNERQLQEQVENYLRQRNIWFCRSRMDRKTTNSLGTPDFLLAVNGHPIALECKFGNGKLKPEQERAHVEMDANGWHVFVVRDLQQVQKILDEVENLERDGRDE